LHLIRCLPPGPERKLALHTPPKTPLRPPNPGIPPLILGVAPLFFAPRNATPHPSSICRPPPNDRIWNRRLLTNGSL
jgi:hypothetical protein